MRKSWSSGWKASTQPRKQRKYRANAPLHVRRKFLSAHVSPELRKSHGKRSIVVRKGDEVRIMRGGSRGSAGVVEKVSSAKSVVYIEGVKITKVDGSTKPKPIHASNVIITKLNLDDKRRQAVLERAGSQKEKRGGG